MITTQQIPATLTEWSKNRGELTFVMQSWGNIAGFLGNAIWGPNAGQLLSRTYAHRKRLWACPQPLKSRRKQSYNRNREFQTRSLAYAPGGDN
jgi:hypothetical protein